MTLSEIKKEVEKMTGTNGATELRGWLWSLRPELTDAEVQGLRKLDLRKKASWAEIAEFIDIVRRRREQREQRETRRETRQAPAGLNRRTLRKMINLCHPDRHGNSAESNELTRILIQMYKAAA